MFVLGLCNQSALDKLPAKVGERLGDGADGEVLSIVDDPDKVIKLGILYEGHNKKLIKPYEQIRNVLNYMAVYKPDAYVRVYEHGYLMTGQREAKHWKSGKQNFIIYYYVMEKLEKISEDEKKIFHTILSHEDRGIKKNYSPSKVSELLQGMSRGLDFDAEKVMIFCQSIADAPVSHLDIHVRNIMKDKVGNYKLIDLDRIELENHDGKE